MKVEQIAQVCHEANRGLALANGDEPSTVWPSWSEAPAAIQDSAVIGVAHALNGATPEQLHESWMQSKAADGWTFGPVRDNAAKVHPCMVPYDQLPAAQRAKDALFSAIVKALT